MTNDAQIAPQKLKTDADTMTAVVELTAWIIDPMVKDRMNCARNTIVLTIPTEKIRICFLRCVSIAHSSAEHVNNPKRLDHNRNI